MSKRGRDDFKITTAEGCIAKAQSIRLAAAVLSDPAAVARAFDMADRWDAKALTIGKERDSLAVP